MVKHSCQLNGYITYTYRANLLRVNLKVEEAIGSNIQSSIRDFGYVGVVAGNEEDLFGMDSVSIAIFKDNFGVVLREEVSLTVEPFYLVFFEIPVGDPFQALDIGVSLGLERRLVERSDLFYGKAIRFGFMQRFCCTGDIPCNLFRYASVVLCQPRGYRVAVIFGGRAPNIDACAP